MYKNIRLKNNVKKPLRIVELRTITKEDVEELKKHLNPFRRAGVDVVE